MEHVYSKGGAFNISLTAVADNGCSSIPVVKPVNVYKTSAFAGYDTLAATNQSITLQGRGEGSFIWSPANGLSDPTSLNPVATLQQDAEYVLTAYTTAGCVNTDTVKIKVYKGPDFYVPNAFTPNGDEKNDRFRCLAVGMASIDFFNVYNRYGQLVFSSGKYEPGWDGTVRGVKQPTGTYVWMARGKDFNGKIHLRKGTVTLIR
jgi:gliding motility-associated-like protein